MEKMKISYKKTTPKRLKKLGNTLAAISAFISTAAFFSDHETVAIVALIMGAVGRGLVEFFTDEV